MTPEPVTAYLDGGIMSTPLEPGPLLDGAPLATLDVEHVFDLRVDLEDPLVFPTAGGTRLTYIVRHGALDGPRVRGELLGGGGDWVVLGADGVGRMDVRATIRTDDGVLIHYASRGVAKLPATGRDTVAAGGRIPYESSYIRSTPRLETTDERYAWLAGLVLVAVSEFSAGHSDHRVYGVR